MTVEPDRPSDAHVLPLGDDAARHTHSRACPCQPLVETVSPETGLPYTDGGAVVLHQRRGDVQTDARDFVIWSFEHAAWWMPGRCGYTLDLEAAGRYSRADAEQIVADANRYRPTPFEAFLLLTDARAFGPPSA